VVDRGADPRVVPRLPAEGPEMYHNTKFRASRVSIHSAAGIPLRFNPTRKTAISDDAKDRRDLSGYKAKKDLT